MQDRHTKQIKKKPTVHLKITKLLYVPVLCLLLGGCTDFVEVDLPKDKLTRETVFSDPGIAEAALRGIYGSMRDTGLLYAHSGLNVFMGIYADEMNDRTGNFDIIEFQTHNLLATNSFIRNWWNATYNQIYEANAVIEGVTNSTALTETVKDQFKGEAYFIRAYLHLYLVELFGGIPYITTTDYLTNTQVTRMSRAVVYENIIKDLILAASLLPEDENEVSTNRIRVYKAVANAVLARAYLYIGDWEKAEAASTGVINKYGPLEPDLDTVFLIASSGILWQFKSELDGRNTPEADKFVIETIRTSTSIALTESLCDAFEPNDSRKDHWIGTAYNSDSTETLNYAFKYKAVLPTGSSVEYSVQLRLAEQYLIRAEARAEQGAISDAQADINAIRNRAGLPNTTATTLEELLVSILQERRVELFTEQGHRWFDLKRWSDLNRTGDAAQVLGPIKSGWRDTDVLLPIPEAELLGNPNLLPQNEGY